MGEKLTKQEQGVAQMSGEHYSYFLGFSVKRFFIPPFLVSIYRVRAQ